MKLRLKALTLFAVFIGCLGIFQVGFAAASTQFEQGHEAVIKGYLSQKDLDVYKEEYDRDFLEVPYGDYAVHNANDLVMLDLWDYGPQGYDLSRPVTLRDGILMTSKIFGYTPNSPTVTPHPFINVPGDLDGQVGYLYEKGILSATPDNTLPLDKTLSLKTYIVMVLKGLGYMEGTDFSTADMMEFEHFVISHNINTYGIRNDTAILAELIKTSWSAIESRPKEGGKRLIERLVELGIVEKERADLFETFLFHRMFPNHPDQTAQVMWKYSRQYDNVYISNYRSGPAPISKSYAWPGQDVELDNAGFIRIGTQDPSLNAQEVLKNILKDLEVPDYHIDKCMASYAEDGKCEYFEYLKRVYNIYTTSTYIHMGIYLDFEK